MKRFLSALCALPLAAALFATPAAAVEYMLEFTISPGSWMSTGEIPYDIDPNATYVGTFTIDDADYRFSSIRAFSLTAGTKTWSIVDLDPSRTTLFYVGLGSPHASFVNFAFMGDQNAFSGGSAVFQEGDNYLACNSCLSFPPVANVPEPGTWALLITGFGMAGAALRRRRTAYAVTG